MIDVARRNKSEVYQQAKSALIRLRDVSQNILDRIDGADYKLIVEYLIPLYRQFVNDTKDVSLLSAAYVESINQYAKEQMGVDVNFAEFYSETRTAVISTVEAVINQIPVDNNGKITVVKISTDGIITYDTISDTAIIKELVSQIKNRLI